MKDTDTTIPAVLAPSDDLGKLADIYVQRLPDWAFRTAPEFLFLQKGVWKKAADDFKGYRVLNSEELDRLSDPALYVLCPRETSEDGTSYALHQRSR